MSLGTSLYEGIILLLGDKKDNSLHLIKIS